MNNYDKRKEIMKTGDCLLWRSPGIVSWLIRRFTSVNHAGLIIRPPNYGPFKDRRFTMEAAGSGVVLRLLSEKLRSFKGEVWLYPLKDEFDEYRSSIGAWSLEKEGTPYDYKSLFKQIFGRVSADMQSFFCSEFCYMAWEAVGIPMEVQKAPMPGGIPNLGIFKVPVLIVNCKP